MYDRDVQPRCSALLVVALVTTGCDDVFGLDLEAAPDAPAVLEDAPVVLGAQGTHAEGVAALPYPLQVVDAPARALLVSVHAGGGCSDVPPVIGVSYAGTPLVQIATITGTPCGAAATVSGQWLLIAPPVGAGEIEITLTPAPSVVHSTALLLTGVDPEAPVRNVTVSSGTGVTATVTVLSAAGDLVVSAVGQGNGIDAVVGAATILRVDNVDNNHATNNSAVSIAPGATPFVTSTWTFTGDNEWQSITTSLRPAPR